MLTKEFLEILCCPETRQPLALAEASQIEQLNRMIAAGTLHNQAGVLISERLDGGLITADKQRLYPIRSEIPVLLSDEAILLAQAK